MVASTGSPDFAFRRYFLSQMSSDAGCSGISTTASRPVAEWVAGARSVLIGFLTSRYGLTAPVDFYLIRQTSFLLCLRRPARAENGSAPCAPQVSDDNDSPSRVWRSAPVLVSAPVLKHKMLWLVSG